MSTAKQSLWLAKWSSEESLTAILCLIKNALLTSMSILAAPHFKTGGVGALSSVTAASELLRAARCSQGWYLNDTMVLVLRLRIDLGWA